MLNFLSAGTNRCDVKIQFLGPRGPFWHPWGALWHHLVGPGPPLGSLGSFLATGSNFDTFPHERVIHLGGPSGIQNPKSHKKTKKTVSEKQCRKNVLPDPM